MPCCKDCTKRVLGCHSTCEEYIVEKAAERKKTKEIQKQRRYQMDLIRTLRGGTRKWHKSK